MIWINFVVETNELRLGAILFGEIALVFLLHWLVFYIISTVLSLRDRRKIFIQHACVFFRRLGWFSLFSVHLALSYSNCPVRYDQDGLWIPLGGQLCSIHDKLKSVCRLTVYSHERPRTSTFELTISGTVVDLSGKTLSSQFLSREIFFYKYFEKLCHFNSMTNDHNVYNILKDIFVNLVLYIRGFLNLPLYKSLIKHKFCIDFNFLIIDY